MGRTDEGHVDDRASASARGGRVSQVVAVAPALPEHRYAQAEITDAFASIVLPAGESRGMLDRLHRNAGVQYRHLALPLEEYARLDGFTAANDAWIRVATELGARAVREALATAGLAPEDVDLVVASDAEAILGIGDWGVGGIDISIGKLAVYTVAAGIDPRRVNGGLFLGLNGTVVKSHGSADETGVSAAIKLAFQLARAGFQDRLAARVAQAVAAPASQASLATDTPSGIAS